MPNIDTPFVIRCIDTLEKAQSLLMQNKQDSLEYEMYRSTCVKEFEIILEQSGKLLKKTLNPFLHYSKAVGQLTFKDIFRQSALHQIINIDESQRWMEYRDNRNSTAHDYGVGFAESTLQLLPQFIIDARSLINNINTITHHAD